MTRSIVYEQSARDDLKEIYFWIADADVALAYIDRIYARCEKLVVFPDRGTSRDEVSAGLRTINFERRCTIAYTVEFDVVRILRILGKGQDVGSRFHN